MALAINKRAVAGGKSVHERQRRRRTIKRTIIVITSLLLLFIIAAIIYTWYMGRHPVQVQQQVVDTSSVAPKIKAPAVDPNAPAFIVQQTFSGPATAGSNSALSIKTNPGAACQVTVKVNNIALPDTGLVPKIADDFGMVDWSWTVPKNVLPGKWPVEVTCAIGTKRSAYYRVELEVTR